MKQQLREISYRSHKSLARGRRVLAVTERAENKFSFTHTRKVFIYQAEQLRDIATPLVEPEISIIKVCDTKTKREKYYFRVKGVFYIIGGRYPIRVNFCHSLLVEIVQKHKIPLHRKGQ